MRSLSSVVRPFVAGFAALSALAVAVPAGAVGGPFNCTTHARMTTSSRTITGNGSMSCDGWTSGLAPRRLITKVQRSRWFGWETMATASSGWLIPPLYSDLYASHKCVGTGTHDFRTVATGEILAAWPDAEEITPVKTVTCASL